MSRKQEWNLTQKAWSELPCVTSRQKAGRHSLTDFDHTEASNKHYEESEPIVLIFRICIVSIVRRNEAHRDGSSVLGEPSHVDTTLLKREANQTWRGLCACPPSRRIR